MKQQTKFKQTEMGKIPEDWKIENLKKVCQLIFSGGTPSTQVEEYWNGNLRWLSSGETRQTFIRDTERKITQTGVNNSSTRLAKIEDVVVAGAGQGYTRGQPSICLIDTYINQSVVALRSNKDKINPFFLFYNLLSRYNELRQLSDAHSSRGSLTTKLLAELPIKLPPLKEQEIVAKILSGLDFKIDLTNKMNKTLEAIGQAIFKRWFVDERKDEWKEGKLGDLGEFKNGINYLRDEAGDTEFSIVNVRDISNNKWILEEPLDKIKINYDKAKDYFLNERDIILARSACPGKISLIFGFPKNIIYSGFSIRYRLKDLDNYYYISFVLEDLDKEIRNFSVGTTLSSVNQETLKNIKIILPDKNLIDYFNKLIQPIFNQISVNCFESLKIAKIRDSLLPKLMSGEIRVK